MRPIALSLLAAALASPALVLPALADRHESPSTRPAQTVTTPKQVQGKWIYGSIGGMTYWDADNGNFIGNARGSAGIFEFDDAGRYREYVYLEMRTGYYTNKAWTVHEGTVSFDRNTFTIRPERGHYQFWTNGKQTTDRDMKPEECEKLSKTYHWTLTKNNDGNEVFTVPFEDGSKMEYRRE